MWPLGPSLGRQLGFLSGDPEATIVAFLSHRLGFPIHPASHVHNHTICCRWRLAGVGGIVPLNSSLIIVIYQSSSNTPVEFRSESVSGLVLGVDMKGVEGMLARTKLSEAEKKSAKVDGGDHNRRIREWPGLQGNSYWIGRAMMRCGYGDRPGEDLVPDKLIGG